MLRREHRPDLLTERRASQDRSRPDGDTRLTRTVPLLLWAVLLGLVLATSVVVAASPRSPLLVDRSEGPSYVAPAPSDADLKQPVDVELQFGAEPTLVWPGFSGTLTSVAASPGATITNGSPVAKVDAVTVTALRTPTPLYRDVTPTTVGPDVAEVGTALSDLGLMREVDVSIRVGTNFRAAILRFNRSRGIDADVITADSVVWLPRDSLRLTRVDLTAGRPAPSRGEIAGNGVADIVSARLVAPEGSSDGLAMPSGRLVVEWQGGRFPVSGSSIDPSAWAELRELITKPEERLRGAVLRLAEPTPSSRVPSSAVIVGADGSTCVASGRSEVVNVKVVSGGPGYVDLLGNLPGRVLANPLMVRVDPSLCRAE